MPIQATPEEYFGQQIANQIEQQPNQQTPTYYFIQSNNQTIFIISVLSIVAIVAIMAIYFKR